MRDVVNGLEVVPPEEDDDGEISDAVRLVLEKGPLVDASQLGVSTHQTLTGVVRSEVERQAPRGHCDEEAEVIDREAKKRPRPMMPE